jgi:hypothetical protein
MLAPDAFHLFEFPAFCSFEQAKTAKLAAVKVISVILGRPCKNETL